MGWMNKKKLIVKNVMKAAFHNVYKVSPHSATHKIEHTLKRVDSLHYKCITEVAFIRCCLLNM